MPKIRIDAAGCIWMATMLTLIPLRWVLAASLAAVVHELGHIITLLLIRAHILEISLGPRGAVIHTPPLLPKDELIAALAGPAAGLMLVFLARWMPLTAFCAGVQSIYNLLPVYPSDGGRALYCAAMLLKGEACARKLRQITAAGTTVVILAAAIYVTIQLRWGLMPFILLFPMVKGLLPEKFLAKQPDSGYNKEYHI